MLIAKFDITDIEQKLHLFETEFKIIFPEQYKAFLLKYNGGRTPKTTFKVNARREETVRSFYGLGLGKIYGLEDHPLLNNWISQGYIPVADEFWGNEFLLGITPSNYGKVYFYDFKKDLMEFVRNDFNSFISSCKSKKIGRIASIQEREQTLIARGLEENITDALRSAWQDEIDLYGNMVQESVILD